MAYRFDEEFPQRPWLAGAARSIVLDENAVRITAEEDDKTHWTDARYCTDQNGDHLDSPAGWDKDL